MMNEGLKQRHDTVTVREDIPFHSHSHVQTFL